MHIKFLKNGSSAAILLALAMPASVQAQDAAQVSPDAPYSETVFFGDGYSDAGFFRPLLPAGVRPVTGQFLDNPGDVWAQFLADYYQTLANPNGNGQAGTDYARGGARVGINSTGALGPISSLSTQSNNYLASNGGRANPNALYGIWGGTTDLLAILNAGAPAATTISNAVNSEVSIVTNLRNAGANYVMVFSTPDLGDAPAFRAMGAAAQANASAVTTSYNSSLFSAMASSNLRVIPIDTFTLFREIVGNPGSFGFANVTGTACQPQITANSLTCNPTSRVSPDASDTYLFADGIFPTSKAQRIVAQYAISILEAPRLMAALPHSAMVSGRTRSQAVFNHVGEMPESDGTRMWLDLRGNFPASDAFSKHDGFGGSVTGGIDRINGHMVYGLFGSFSSNDFDFSQNRGSYRQREMGLGAFAGYSGKRFWANGQIGYNWIQHRIERDVALGSVTRTHQGSPDGSNVTVGINAGYLLGTGRLKHGPVAGILAQRIKIEDFAESDANLSTALAYPEQKFSSTIGSVGYQLSYEVTGNFTPYVKAFYDHEFGDYKSEAFARSLTVAGSLPFAVPGVQFDKKYGSAIVGVRAKIGRADIDIGATGTFGQQHGSDATAFARVNMTF